VERMNAKGTPNVKYMVQDMTNMTDFKSGEFDHVLDKATWDAICADKKKDTKKMCFNYLKECMRVVKKEGSYFCVSLLQEFVF
jgi:ubiquinone/menaquinone biosynthesis C-methylase UbiE